MRIVCLIPNLKCGGRESQLVLLSSFWQSAGNEVVILSLSDPGDVPFFPIPSGVKYLPLGLWSESWSPAALLRLCQGLAQAVQIEEPDIVFSCLPRMNLVACAIKNRFKAPLVVFEPTVRDYARERGYDWIRKIMYRRAEKVVFQLSSIQQQYPRNLQDCSVVIPNLVLPVRGEPGLRRDMPQRRTLGALGRLVAIKGFDKLIRAFSDLARDFPEWDLVIWGEGPQREELERLCDSLGLAGRIALPGVSRNVHADLQRLDLFVLPSLFEGFPNTLCEAMACGVAVAAFKCPGAVSEIIVDGVSGMLIADQDTLELTRVLANLMGDEAKRSSLGRKARERTVDFGPEKLVPLWLQLFETVVRDSSNKLDFRSAANR